MKHELFKVVEGKHNDWKSWCEFLCDRQQEAEETMREENCVYERSVIFERDGDHYMVGSCLYYGEPKKANLNIELNVKHQNAKNDCLSKAISIFEGEFLIPPTHEVLYEFDLR
jgi:hypothetical protein